MRAVCGTGGGGAKCVDGRDAGGISGCGLEKGLLLGDIQYAVCDDFHT